MKRLFLFALLYVATGCAAAVTADESEKGAVSSPPIAEFDPANQIIPLPNNLLLNPATRRLAIPPRCGEMPGSAAALLRTELNELDGFGTSKLGVVTTFSAPVDPNSLAGHVFLFRIAAQGAPLAAPEPVAIDVAPSKSIQMSTTCASREVASLTMVPTAPLAGASTYAVALLRGIKNTSGTEFEPTATWALVRQKDEPVTLDPPTGDDQIVTKNLTPFDPTDPDDLARIKGLDLLWKAHNAAPPLLPVFDALLPAVGVTYSGRNDILMAWSFNTQTIVDPFDPMVAGTPAAALASDTATDAPTMPPALAGEGGLPVDLFFAIALPGVPCSALHCSDIGSIYLGAAQLGAAAPTFVSPSYQPAGFCDSATPTTAPGRWSDPIKPTKACDLALQFVAVTPASPPSAAGYETVIFGHGLGRSKEDLLAIAGLLASQGIATVAIDAVDHGSRAVQISTDAAIGCDQVGSGKPCNSLSCAPQCFAPPLSSDLAVTRDNLRQTVLDQMKLQRVLKHCATAGACGQLWVDAGHIGYLGQSLGSLIGGVTGAVSPDVKVAVLNVGAADWVQIFSDTETVQIRCPIIDSLIDAGILMGTKWNNGANQGALCLDPAASWKTDPGFLQFAQTARWMLDPIDGVNYAGRYRTGTSAKVFLAEVIGDLVVPNSATDEFGKLLGLTPLPANRAIALPPMVTPAAAGASSTWIQYANIPVEGTFPGNFYAHGSMLQPAPNPTMPTMTTDPGGVLGTALMQADALTYLVSHL